MSEQQKAVALTYYYGLDEEIVGPPMQAGYVYAVTYAKDGAPIAARKIGRIDPSTIRDVTPPESPNAN